MATKLSRTLIRAYKTYNFKDKDPIIDQIRTIVQDTDATAGEIQEGTGVSTTTLYNWFEGATKRPQNATSEAVIRFLGYERKLIKVREYKK